MTKINILSFTHPQICFSIYWTEKDNFCIQRKRNERLSNSLISSPLMSNDSVVSERPKYMKINKLKYISIQWQDARFAVIDTKCYWFLSTD